MPALHQTYYGRVLSCDVVTSGGDHTSLRTILTVDPMEPPGAHGALRSTPEPRRRE